MWSSSLKRIFIIIVSVFGNISSGSGSSISDCCSFDSSSCGSTNTWIWSGQYPAPEIPINSSPYIEIQGGHFLWSNTYRDEWESEVYANVTSTTLFTLQYFVQFPGDSLAIYFRDPSAGEDHYLPYPGYVDGRWHYVSFYCDECCGSQSFCQGQLVITTFNTFNYEVAIDNIGRDQACLDSQCCNFDSESCTWESSTWKNSNSGSTPNLDLYPSFTSTETDEDYTFVQDKSGSTKSQSTFYIPANGTVIEFNYYFDSPNVDAANYFQVQFHNSATVGSNNTLLTINTARPTWQQAQITCNATNNYCCGSSTQIPCSGVIEIAAIVDATNQEALFAIDSIGTTCVSPPTVPPPTPGCCEFETDECGSYHDGVWYWSARTPTSYVPANSGYFEWTNANFSSWESEYQTEVSANTLFTFQYYIQSTGAQLNFGFKEYLTDGTNYIGTVKYLSNEWHSQSFNCDSCCQKTSPCSGQLFITAIILDRSEVAIDNIGRDNVCVGLQISDGLFSCCLFDDPTICDFVYGSQSGYTWHFSGYTYPAYSVPTPNSSFVYFEAIGYDDPLPISVGLRSDFLTIDSNTIFRGHFFIYNPYMISNTNALKVSFNNTGTGQSTELSASITSTDSTWQILYFYCDSIYGNCCQGASSCTGYIDFEAVVDEYAGHVVYAIDAFEVDGGCSTFPG